MKTTIATTAKRMFPRAAWITGDGPWACIAHCRATTVSLHRTQVSAETARDFIDAYGCGGRCTRDHVVANIEKVQ